MKMVRNLAASERRGTPTTGYDAAVSRMLGPDTRAILTAVDQETDKAALADFAAKYVKINRWVDMSDGSRGLYIGADNFAFPVPLVKAASGQWYFDGVAGAEETRLCSGFFSQNRISILMGTLLLPRCSHHPCGRSGSSPSEIRRVQVAAIRVLRCDLSL
jgi:hypothetical protein